MTVSPRDTLWVGGVLMVPDDVLWDVRSLNSPIMNCVRILYPEWTRLLQGCPLFPILLPHCFRFWYVFWATVAFIQQLTEFWKGREVWDDMRQGSPRTGLTPGTAAWRTGAFAHGAYALTTMPQDVPPIAFPAVIVSQSNHEEDQREILKGLHKYPLLLGNILEWIRMSWRLLQRREMITSS